MIVDHVIILFLSFGLNRSEIEILVCQQLQGKIIRLTVEVTGDDERHVFCVQLEVLAELLNLMHHPKGRRQLDIVILGVPFVVAITYDDLFTRFNMPQINHDPAFVAFNMVVVT